MLVSRRRVEIDEIEDFSPTGEEYRTVLNTTGAPDVLCNAPRSVRVQAIRMLDDLVKALTREAQSILRSVRAANPSETVNSLDEGDKDGE